MTTLGALTLIFSFFSAGQQPYGSGHLIGWLPPHMDHQQMPVSQQSMYMTAPMHQAHMYYDMDMTQSEHQPPTSGG